MAPPFLIREGKDMDICVKIEQEIAPSLASAGYDLVRVVLSGADVKTVQVMAERKDRGHMTLKDCEIISRTVSALLDVMDPFAGRWTLEVSSPGIDRPLIKPEDYVRFSGFYAKIETVSDINGRKRFKGQILGFDPKTSKIAFEFEGQKIEFDFNNIAKAKLILTDELIQNSKH